MAYKVKLTRHGETVFECVVYSDVELYWVIGKMCVDYFLALDKIDINDAKWHDAPLGERILAFTCDKANDEPGYKRHGLRKGVFAVGKAWSYRGKFSASVEVERIQ